MQDSTKLFKDPVNPTTDELKLWAYGNYYTPIEDFELFIVDDPYFALEFATDKNCPTKDFFLGSLYVRLGDSVRSKRANKEELEKFLEVAGKTEDDRLRLFVERAKQLIRNPEIYDYSQWGLGGEYTEYKL